MARHSSASAVLFGYAPEMGSELTYDLWATAAARAAAMTAAGQEPRRHHLVPRFYIDRWAVDGRVRVVDLLRGRNAYEVSPVQAALETDFYRLDEPDDATSPVYWEAWLSEVEEKAAASIARVDAAGPGAMDDETHQWLCLFLAVADDARPFCASAPACNVCRADGPGPGDRRTWRTRRQAVTMAQFTALRLSSCSRTAGRGQSWDFRGLRWGVPARRSLRRPSR